jgi:hypothetical protein
VIKNDLKGRSKNAIKNRYFALRHHPRPWNCPKPATAQEALAVVNQQPTLEMKPKPEDPFAFLDPEQEEMPIHWQSDLDPSNQSFFF